MEHNVFPSPLIDEVTIIVLFFLFFSLNRKWILERIALNDSAMVDFGFKNTAKLFFAVFFPTTPKTGIE